MTKTRLWLVLTAVAVVAVLAGGWFLLVSPKRDEAGDLRAQTASTEQQIAVLRGRLDQLRAQQADLPAQQAVLEQISKQIPTDPALPALIRALTKAARSSGVDLASMQPSAPAPLAPVGTTTGTAATPIQVIQLAVTAQGTYAQVQQFVSRLETLQRAFLVRGFQLAPKSDGGANALQLTVDGQVFTAAATSAGTAGTAATSGTVAN
jgi:Tfp pilus assembly protein PilO